MADITDKDKVISKLSIDNEVIASEKNELKVVINDMISPSTLTSQNQQCQL
jgi:hypothetical protein